jgi:site-specific recombinase XerC
MSKKLIKFISTEDFQRVLKAEKDNRFKLAYVLAFGSGLRISEIVGPATNSNQEIKPIQASQIDLASRQIKILGKGGKERITVINPLFPIKDTMLKLLPLEIERRTLQNHFTKLSEKVLGKRLNFHTLRHGFANHMLNERGLPMPMVQGFGGWARLDTVGIYAKANPIQAIEKVWEGF